MVPPREARAVSAAHPAQPLLPILSRYLLRETGRIFVLAMAAFLLLYLLVDFFDRLNTFLKHDAGWGTVARYLLLKIPLIITQMTPAATFAAILLGLGLLARYNEITALRACGVSTWQIGRPLLSVAALVSAATLGWNELLVPQCSARSHYVETVQIKKRLFPGVLSERGLWYYGRQGIYNIDYFDSKTNTIHGLTLYEFTPQFELRRLVEVESARWDGKKWRASRVTERLFPPGQELVSRTVPPQDFDLQDKPEDFTLARKEPEDLSFWQLRKHVVLLRARGIDTTEEAVDLHLKLALPAMPFVLALVAVPLASHRARARNFATSVATGIGVGFAYYVTLALSRSLGQAGAISPVVASWSANAVFALVGIFLFLGSE